MQKRVDPRAGSPSQDGQSFHLDFGLDPGGPPDTGPPDPAPLTIEERLEQRHGSSPRHRQVSSLVTELARTTRSFLLYDARNAAIHHFLTSLLESFVAALDPGPVQLTIQPFELWFDGEAVYLDRDRERSLSFRLYRDGVRGLTFRPGFHWEELSRLLEVLSIRYTGVHQHEDDVVTLLWKANFKHLDVVAVEGFVPDDEDDAAGGTLAHVPAAPALFPEADSTDRHAGNAPPPTGDPGDRSSRNRSGSADALRSAVADAQGHGASPDGAAPGLPDHLDLPSPPLLEPSIPEWLDVPETRLAALRDEVGGSALPQDCLALIRHCGALLEDPRFAWNFADVAHLYTEVRNFLLVEEHLAALERFIDLLEHLCRLEPPPWDPLRAQAARELLRSCGDDAAVRKLLHSVPLERRKLEPGMVRLLERVSPEPLTSVLNALAVEQGIATRAVARQLLEHFGPGRLEVLQRRFAESAGHLACDLLRVIAHIGGEKAAAFVATQCSHPDSEVQTEALRHLRQMPYSGAVGHAIFEAFKTGDTARRQTLLELMLHIGDRRFGDHLATFVEQSAGQISLEDARHYGLAAGKLSGDRAIERWREWLKPSGWIRKTLPGPAPRQVAAAWALAVDPREEAEKTIRDALKVAGEPVHRWLGLALSHQLASRRKQTGAT